MSNRKNYNSIVFLTVYLGLVLVGGSAQVLAQAATPRLFDIKTEIVVEDDLDKKPDDGEGKIDFARSLDRYFDDVESLIKDLKTLHKIDRFDSEYNTFDIDESIFSRCGYGNTIYAQEISLIQRKSYWINDRWLDGAITDALVKLQKYGFLSDCSNYEVFENRLAYNSKYILFFDESELKLEISAPKSSPDRARILAENFAQASKIYKVDADKPIVKIVHQNTSYKSENNQVFIVTRLPRGSIDELLAEKDAQ